MEYGRGKPNFGPAFDDADSTPTPPQPMTSAFDHVLQNLTQRRGDVYGDPYDDFGRVALLKEVLADCPDPRIRHVLEMIAVKMSRLIETPGHLDSWADIAGYARTACMVLDATPREQKVEVIDEQIEDY